MSKKAIRMGYTARSRLSRIEEKMLFSLTKREGTTVSEWIRLQIHQQHKRQLEVDLGLDLAPEVARGLGTTTGTEKPTKKSDGAPANKKPAAKKRASKEAASDAA